MGVEKSSSQPQTPNIHYVKENKNTIFHHLATASVDTLVCILSAFFSVCIFFYLNEIY